MPKAFLTIREAAQILGVTPLTLRNWDRRGLLAAYRNPMNNYRLYRYADIADLIAEIRNTRVQPGEIQRLSIRNENEDLLENGNIPETDKETENLPLTEENNLASTENDLYEA